MKSKKQSLVNNSNKGKVTEKNSYHHGDLYRVLLDAGEQELNERGVEKFSMRGVAKRANVSHAAPAHYFSNNKGLLTALATAGFTLFLEMQLQYEKKRAKSDMHPLVAAGLGYIEFANTHSGMFRLMFASDQPDWEDVALKEASCKSYEHLIELVHGESIQPESLNELQIQDVISAWAIVHGMSHLYISGQLEPLSCMKKKDYEAYMANIISRVLPAK